MRLQELADSEKQALGALVIALVEVDHDYSASEVIRLQKTAEYLGEDEFWPLVNDPRLRSLDNKRLATLVQAVERPEAREAMYGVLFGISVTDPRGSEETRLLTWLSEIWGLQTGS